MGNTGARFPFKPVGKHRNRERKPEGFAHEDLFIRGGEILLTVTFHAGRSGRHVNAAQNTGQRRHEVKLIRIAGLHEAVFARGRFGFFLCGEL